MREERRVTKKIEIEAARLIFKNFRGIGSQYNKEGGRNVGVLLDDETADQLMRDGWNVKYLRPMDDDPDQYRQPWLKVNVKFSKYPPVIEVIGRKGRRSLTEETVGELDYSKIEGCDIVIRPYNYPAMPNRPAGVSAYLDELYVTIAENRFAQKYADIPYMEDEE